MSHLSILKSQLIRSEVRNSDFTQNLLILYQDLTFLCFGLLFILSEKYTMRYPTEDKAHKLQGKKTEIFEIGWKSLTISLTSLKMASRRSEDAIMLVLEVC